jgi:hypothetical protein
VTAVILRRAIADANAPWVAIAAFMSGYAYANANANGRILDYAFTVVFLAIALYLTVQLIRSVSSPELGTEDMEREIVRLTNELDDVRADRDSLLADPRDEFAGTGAPVDDPVPGAPVDPVLQDVRWALRDTFTRPGYSAYRRDPAGGDQ